MSSTVLAIVPTPEHGSELESALRSAGAEVTIFLSVGEAIDALPGITHVFDAVLVVDAKPEGLAKLRAELEALQTSAPLWTVLGDAPPGFIALAAGDAQSIATQLVALTRAQRSRTLEYREVAQLAAAPTAFEEPPAWVVSWVTHGDFAGPCAVRVVTEGFNADLARRAAETSGRGLADVERIALDDPRPHVLFSVPPGTSAAVLLDSKVQLPHEIVAAIARSMAHAIEALHLRGCELAALHPGLVWLGEDGLIRHLGRGIATSDDLDGSVRDARADVRRLGMLLARLLRGPGEAATAASSTDLGRAGRLGAFVDACILEPPAVGSLTARVESIDAATSTEVAAWLERITGSTA